MCCAVVWCSVVWCSVLRRNVVCCAVVCCAVVCLMMVVDDDGDEWGMSYASVISQLASVAKKLTLYVTDE